MRELISSTAPVQSAHALRSSPTVANWESSPGTILQQIYTLSEQARATAEVEVLRSHQLDMRAWLVLRALDELKCATQRQIAAATDLDKVAVNRAASWLKELDLVASLPNADDGRSHLLQLSPAGAELIACCGRGIARLESAMLAGLTDGESWQLFRSLQHLHRALSYRL